jgi:large subunit ribosomal protein L25
MDFVVKSDKRSDFGKNASRRIRKTGRIPAILYGEGEANVALVLDKKDVFRILRSETGENTIFQIVFDAEKRDVMFKDLQTDPSTDELLHADLIQIAMDKAIRVAVPVELAGEPVGVKTEGGFIDFMTREVEIECLPGNIPERLTVDIAGLHLHQSLKVADIVAPEGVKIMSDPGTVVILIQVPHEEKVEAAPAEEEVVAAPAEPEVIKKERAEKEEEEK